MIRNFPQRYFSLLLALIIAGCSQKAPDQSFWNGTLLRTDGKKIAFRAFVSLEPSSTSAYFVVGDEKTPVPEVQYQSDSLIFFFPEYHAAMRGTVRGNDWSGNYIRYRQTPVAVPFTATAEPPPMATPADSAHAAIPLVGKFQAYIQDGNRIDSSKVATFWMRHDSIFGTLIAPDGDYGFNAGIQHGTTVTLNRFTGWQAQMFEFTQTGSSWRGALYTRDEQPELITLASRPTLTEKLTEAEITRAQNPNSSFVFSGVTPEGDTLTSTSSLFRGKAVLVDVMGTWCHNCMDETPVLEQLYREYADKGLVVVGLSFEISDNAGQAATNLRLYRKRFGLTFPLLFCGSTDDKYVAPQLRRQLSNFYAFPTAIFIDRKGRVKDIHVGFKGPGTGEEFQAEIKELYNEVRQITGA